MRGDDQLAPVRHLHQLPEADPGFRWLHHLQGGVNLVSGKFHPVPVDRLLEYQANGVIGKLNNVWWSLNGWIPNAQLVAEQLAPQVAERVARYEIQAALLIPASRLCHQTLGILARALEKANVPTMLLSVDREMTDLVRPPRTAYYNGEIGAVVGRPNSKQFQLRVLDESLRWIETFDQPGARRLAVHLENQIQHERGEQ